MGLVISSITSVCAKSLQLCLTLCDALDRSHFMGFSRHEYWSELPCPPPGDPPDPGIKPGSPMSPALADKFFTTSITWKGHACIHIQNFWKDKQESIISIDLWRWVGKQERRFVPFLFYLLCFTMSYINFMSKTSEKKAMCLMIYKC